MPRIPARRRTRGDGHRAFPCGTPGLRNLFLNFKPTVLAAREFPAATVYLVGGPGKLGIPTPEYGKFRKFRISGFRLPESYAAG